MQHKTQQPSNFKKKNWKSIFSSKSPHWSVHVANSFSKKKFFNNKKKEF